MLRLGLILQFIGSLLLGSGLIGKKRIETLEKAILYFYKPKKYIQRYSNIILKISAYLFIILTIIIALFVTLITFITMVKLCPPFLTYPNSLSDYLSIQGIPFGKFLFFCFFYGIIWIIILWFMTMIASVIFNEASSMEKLIVILSPFWFVLLLISIPLSIVGMIATTITVFTIYLILLLCLFPVLLIIDLLFLPYKYAYKYKSKYKLTSALSILGYVLTLLGFLLQLLFSS